MTASIYKLFFAMNVFTLSFVASPTRAMERTLGEQKFCEAVGRDCPVVPLWPENKAPDEPRVLGDETVSTTYRDRTGLLNIANVTRPSMIIVSPPKEKNTAAALVLCPGGGYGSLACVEVVETARWMNQRGITVVLLKYRVPKRHRGYPMNHQPLQDAQRAFSILRSRAAEWDVDPRKIGVGGFSAGGHLAASLSLNHQKRHYDAVDEFDQTSCRPNFSVLLYPAYLTAPILSRSISDNLGIDQISDTETPPTFISVTRPDKFTIGATEFYLRLIKADVASELHVYPDGGHGGAIKKYPFGEWAPECLRFLADQGIIEGPAPPASFKYMAKKLPDIEASDRLTLGDQRIRQILGRDCSVVSIWPKGTGPDETGPDETGPATAEVVTARSRGGSALNIRNVARPTLTVVSPSSGKGKGTAVIVCPGGGYSGLAAEHEGTRVCQWLNESGITGVLLKYRVPRRGGDFAKHHHAFQDLQRAIRIVRSQGSQWGIDPNRIGVCGFSAGGHLSAMLCENFDDNTYKRIDAIDDRNCRPDFGILVYPAYLTDPIDSDDVPATLKRSKRNVTPPLFMVSARNDRFTPGMLNFFLDVREARVPAECHVYATGGHGGGLDPISYPTSEWPKACLRWLKDLEFEN